MGTLELGDLVYNQAKSLLRYQYPLLCPEHWTQHLGPLCLYFWVFPKRTLATWLSLLGADGHQCERDSRVPGMTAW